VHLAVESVSDFSTEHLPVPPKVLHLLPAGGETLVTLQMFPLLTWNTEQSSALAMAEHFFGPKLPPMIEHWREPLAPGWMEHFSLL
jgi:hypothetical protein